MVVHGFLMSLLAQTCVSMLPPPQAEIEWFSDGSPYALDVPLRSTRTERVYRRVLDNGRTTERVISCTTTGGVTYFSERVGSAVTVRIPVALKVGSTRTVDRATVRRIAPPAGAATRAAWFSVSNPGVKVYGLQTGLGVAEVRTPSSSGGFSVLRSMPRDAAPARAMAAADSQRQTLEMRIAELETTVATLRDTISALRAPPAPGDVPELGAINTYLQAGAYHDALALLAHTRARISERPHSGMRFRSLALLDERTHAIINACVSTRYGRFVPRSAAASQRRNNTGSIPLPLLVSCAARPRFR